jgi:hypothetical protein
MGKFSEFVAVTGKPERAVNNCLGNLIKLVPDKELLGPMVKDVAGVLRG